MTVSTQPEWEAVVDSNAAFKFSRSDTFPDASLVEELVSRLIQRSNSSTGFDRALLKRLNKEAWGASEE